MTDTNKDGKITLEEFEALIIKTLVVSGVTVYEWLLFYTICKCRSFILFFFYCLKPLYFISDSSSIF